MKQLAILLLSLFSLGGHAQIQDEEVFGRLSQGNQNYDLRFFASWDSGELFSLSYAPLGFKPVFVDGLRQDSSGYLFRFQPAAKPMSFRLNCEEAPAGRVYHLTSVDDSLLSITLKPPGSDRYTRFGAENRPSVEDLRILDRAEQLMAGGRSWCKECDQYCNSISYPFRWSLFCALHQASMEMQNEYLNQRPVMQAIRLAIAQQHPGKEWDDALNEFNLIASDYSAVKAIIAEAREMLMLRIASAARNFNDFDGPPAGYNQYEEIVEFAEDPEGS